MKEGSSEKANEKTRLSETVEALQEGYGSDSHAVFQKSPIESEGDKHLLIDYKPLKLSTFRVFTVAKLTVLQEPLLHTEQILISLIFTAVAALVYFAFKEQWAENRAHDDLSVRRWIANQEGKMRAFAMIMTGLAAFLLSFYTSVCVTRWWTMRTAGIGGIKSATLDLEWLLYQNVTQDRHILHAVRRYGRTSMVLLFLWRQGVPDQNLKEELMKRELLNEKEADKLVRLQKGARHETIWAWLGAIVAMLQHEGKIASDQMYNTLIEKCTDGRMAVQCAHTHLAVKVPMQYVHLLGLLVKMHNFVVAVIMGALFGVALREGEFIICVQTFARTLILPFLFNAILLINANLSDPFNGDDTDFPASAYQIALDKDCQGFMDATDNMPDWLQERFDKARPEGGSDVALLKPGRTYSALQSEKEKEKEPV